MGWCCRRHRAPRRGLVQRAAGWSQTQRCRTNRRRNRITSQHSGTKRELHHPPPPSSNNQRCIYLPIRPRYLPTCAMIAMFRMCSGSTAIAVPSSAEEDVDSIRRARALPRAATPSGPCVACLVLHLIEEEERKARRQAPESIITLAGRPCSLRRNGSVW